jgi:hypothetical protein
MPGSDLQTVHIRDYDDPMPGGLERKTEKDLAGNGHHHHGVTDGNTATTTGASTTV